MEDKDFFKEYYSYGIIVRATLEDIHRMKSLLREEFPNIEFIYNKFSKLPLRLVESKSSDGKFYDE